MRLVRIVAAALVAGALVAFVVALVRPRRRDVAAAVAEAPAGQGTDADVAVRTGPPERSADPVGYRGEAKT
jgi:hypothetical protein